MSFRENKGDLGKGGNVRAPGEEEPDVLKTKGLSEVEIAEYERTEALNRTELEILEKSLAKMHLRAADALQNPERMEALVKEVNPSTQMRPNVRFFKFKEHLKELDRQDRAKRFGK